MGTSELSQQRAAALAFYSPYHFLPQFAEADQQRLFGTGLAAAWKQQDGAELLAAPGVTWLLRRLAWDSAYFETPTYRLFTGLFADTAPSLALVQAAAGLRQQLAQRHAAYYCFAQVPAEDVALLQALTGGGWRLVETRLTYYHDHLADVEHPLPAVRLAAPAEAAQLGRVAAEARNPYDRFHADPWYGPEKADAYLARYAENTLTGPQLAAAVLVPDVLPAAVNAFLAISDLREDSATLGRPLSRVLLAAVGEEQRGWHARLLAATLLRARALGHAAVLMTTQATNRAVVRNAEKLGFRLGATTHVLACHGE
jgi:dTDP-4-amino-4,6-dideoxy-D-galactose acyltransferase